MQNEAGEFKLARVSFFESHGLEYKKVLAGALALSDATGLSAYEIIELVSGALVYKKVVCQKKA